MSEVAGAVRAGCTDAVSDDCWVAVACDSVVG